MKRTIYFLVLLAFITSCKAWDPSMINVKKDPITPKLLTLEKKMADMSNVAIFTTEDELKLFTKEVEENIIDPYGDKYGYIAIKSTTLDTKLGNAFYIPSLILCCIPNILGLPLQVIKHKVEVEIRILDKNNKLIGKYSAVGESKVIVAFYYGYSLMKAPRKSYTDALIDAFSKLHPQIQADANRINDKLNEAGKL